MFSKMTDTNNQIDFHANWSTPSPHVGSGFDIRSNENGLLAIMYGSLERASHFNWLNAGRTLVDKTYIHLLWQAKRLPAIGVTHHDIATALELFVREQLQPVWPEIKHLTAEEAQQLAIDLVTNAADSLFGSSYQEEAASWLLYYLCPQLPIFPVTETLRDTIALRHSESNEPGTMLTHCYASYHHGCSELFDELRDKIQSPLPIAHYGTDNDIETINRVITDSDWWPRYCLIHQVQAN